MYKVKEFKTSKEKNDFMEKNKDRYVMEEVFINNSYGVDYTEKLIIDIK